MAQIDPSSELVRQKVSQVWDLTISFCNKVLQHCDVYGIQLMDIPDPNVHQMHHSLSVVVLPMLEKLSEDPNVDLEPEDGIRIANIKQYIWHLSNVVSAIIKDNEQAFDEAVMALSREAHICGRA